MPFGGAGREGDRRWHAPVGMASASLRAAAVRRVRTVDPFSAQGCPLNVRRFGGPGRLAGVMFNWPPSGSVGARRSGDATWNGKKFMREGTLLSEGRMCSGAHRFPLMPCIRLRGPLALRTVTGSTALSAMVRSHVEPL